MRRLEIMIVRRPRQLGINEELQWFGSCLGLFGDRDKDKSCFRVFLELVKAAKQRRVLSSDELGALLRLSRPTIIHHIHTLEERGLVVQERSKYVLRTETLEQTLHLLKQDMTRALDDLEHAAREIDRIMEL